MELGRAVSYIFEDKNWVSKLVPLLIVAVLSLIPILGLLPAAIGIGFMAQLAQNVREGLPRPLPKWDDWQVKFQIGGQIVLAMIVYNLPAIFMSMCSYVLISGIAGGFFVSTIQFVVICCTAPILFVYSLIAWSMLAIGVTEYMEHGDAQRMYRFIHLWDVMRTHNNIIFQWVLAAILVNIIMGILVPIIFFGWVLIWLFAYPIHGHLLGQFAHRLHVQKPKPNRVQSN